MGTDWETSSIYIMGYGCGLGECPLERAGLELPGDVLREEIISLRRATSFRSWSTSDEINCGDSRHRNFYDFVRHLGKRLEGHSVTCRG